MKKTALFIITFLTLFAYANADAYKDGFIIGYVTGTIGKKHRNNNNEEKFIKYNKQIIDTSLFDFPIQKNPKCVEIKIKEVTYATFMHKLFVSIMVILCFSFIIHECSNGTDDDRDRLIGIIIGSMLA